ncbi:hypothetical protein HKD37_01G001578 [Glycine soja]
MCDLGTKFSQSFSLNTKALSSQTQSILSSKNSLAKTLVRFNKEYLSASLYNLSLSREITSSSSSYF